jgi:hypothetical protein
VAPQAPVPSWHGDCVDLIRKKEGSSMARIIIPALVVAFAGVMTYAFYLQAKIWHLL